MCVPTKKFYVLVRNMGIYQYQNNAIDGTPNQCMRLLHDRYKAAMYGYGGIWECEGFDNDTVVMDVFNDLLGVCDEANDAVIVAEEGAYSHDEIMRNNNATKQDVDEFIKKLNKKYDNTVDYEE